MYFGKPHSSAFEEARAGSGRGLKRASPELREASEPRVLGAASEPFLRSTLRSTCLGRPSFDVSEALLKPS